MSENIVKLGDIGQFIRGSGITKSDIVSENGHPCIRYAEIYTEYGEVIRNPLSMVSEDGAASALRLQKGDVIFPTSGETATEIGKAAAFVGDDETYVGGDAIVLRGHSQNAIFLAHALNSWESNRQKYRLATGNSVVHIYAQELAQISLWLPAAREQQAIVEILSDCDAAIEKHERLCKLHQMKAAYELENIHAMLAGLHNAEPSNIGDLVISRSLRGHQLSRKNYGESGQLPIIDQSEDLICGYTDNVDLAIENVSGVVIFGDHTRVVKLYRGPFVAGADGTKILSPKDKTIPIEYLKFLVSKAVKSIPDLGYSRHFSELRRVSIPVLTGQACEQFVRVNNEVERQKSIYNVLIDQLLQRKRGLMQQLLTGKLRVKGAA